MTGCLFGERKEEVRGGRDDEREKGLIMTRDRLRRT